MKQGIRLIVLSPLIALIAVLTMVVPEVYAGPIVYVNASATGGMDDGSSWADAYVDLQSAISAVSGVGGSQIWVAAGTYEPGTSPSDTFHLLSGVEIYGGFAGGESQLSDRDPEINVTILNGDIDGVGGPSLGDVRNVVTATGNVDSSAVLDGFTITGGNADSGSSVCGSGDVENCGGGIALDWGDPILSNLIIDNNYANAAGGGIFVSSLSQPTLVSVTIKNNFAEIAGGGLALFGDTVLIDVTVTNNSTDTDGGGIYVVESAAEFIKGTVSGNSAIGRGGGFYVEGSLSNNATLKLTNVLVSGNQANGNGGGLFLRGSVFAPMENVTVVGNRSLNDAGGGLYLTEIEASAQVNMDNSILAGNVASASGPQIERAPGFAFFESSFVEGSGGSASWDNTFGIDGGNNIDIGGAALTTVFESPESGASAPTSAGNYRLVSGSPAIDAGNTALLPADSQDLDDDDNLSESIPFDRDGDARVQNGAVDMGAYESTPAGGTPPGGGGGGGGGGGTPPEGPETPPGGTIENLPTELENSDFEGLTGTILPEDPGENGETEDGVWYVAFGSPQVYSDPSNLIDNGDSAILLIGSDENNGLAGIFQDKTVNGSNDLRGDTGDTWELDFYYAFQGVQSDSLMGAQIQFRNGKDIVQTVTCATPVSGTSGEWLQWSANNDPCTATAEQSYTSLRVFMGWRIRGGTGFGGIDNVGLTQTNP
ncbi:MAG: hypothetical protein GYB68_06800 [Chloroflexi bacterium]|nr:hypothetical protein [Chloroflexota bacterium]